MYSARTLVAFRDTSGRVGIVDAYCAHRGSPLFFGRNEQNGIRCVYHGWKYDIEGTCVDMPNCSEGESFREKIQIVAYPAVDKGDFIWTYMGPPELQPPVPGFGFMDVPESHRENWKIISDCNYLQSMEGNIDPSHAFFLHSTVDPMRDPSVGILGNPQQQMLNRRSIQLPELYEDTEYGVRATTVRDLDNGEKQVNIGHWVLPCFGPGATLGGGLDLRYLRCRISIDDVTSMVLRVWWSEEQSLPAEFREAHNGYLIPEMVPGTYRPKANRSNDYLIDRVLQKNYNFTGINVFRLQDICQIEDQRGPVMDRTREHLTSSDQYIIHMRNQLMKGARDLLEDQEPTLPRKPGLFDVVCTMFNVPKDKPVQEAVEEALPAIVRES